MRGRANRAVLYILPTVVSAVALNVPKFFEIQVVKR